MVFRSEPAPLQRSKISKDLDPEISCTKPEEKVKSLVPNQKREFLYFSFSASSIVLYRGPEEVNFAFSPMVLEFCFLAEKGLRITLCLYAGVRFSPLSSGP